MPGQRPNNLRGGDRSEYLAQFLLATLGVSVQVPRQEDIGVDFYCSLAKLEGQNLTFQGSYIVQTKSTPTDAIRYGGPDGKGGRRSEEIRWLFSQELPLLIGFVDKRALSIHLYTTSNMWAAFYVSGGPGEILLEPSSPETRSYEYAVPVGESVEGWEGKIGDGRRWRVPLGPPILSFTADQAEDKNAVANARERLRPFILTEQSNIGYRRLNIHYSRTPYVLEVSDDDLQTVGHFVALVGNKTLGANVDEQLLSIAPGLGTMAFNLREQKRFKELQNLRPVAQMIPDGQERETLERNFPELYN